MRAGPVARALLSTALLAAGLLAWSCAAALRHPTSQDAAAASVRRPGTSLQDLERGRRLYVRRCAGCHTLVLPQAYGADDWPALVDAMAERARLDPGQKADVTRFLATLAPAVAPPPATPPQR